MVLCLTTDLPAKAKLLNLTVNMAALFANKREEWCLLVQVELVFTSIQGLLYHH